MYTIRIGGTNDFLSRIVWRWEGRSIETVSGWANPEALRFETYDRAYAARLTVERIDGCGCSVEEEI